MFTTLLRKSLALFAVAAAVFAVTGPAAAAPGSGTPRSVTYYEVRAQHSGQCLDVWQRNPNWGTPDVQWPCYGGSGQLWEKVPVYSSGGHVWYALKVQMNGLCLDVRDGSRAAGAVVQQWACNNTLAQQWEVWAVGGNYVSVVNRGSGMCLDVKDISTYNGAAIQQWPCWNNPGQHWWFA
ncbi:RICIN domain-containing protein [Longispora sp. NPDC051575]|uniref:RICIN domain-containing protein n=1 Tax=Longispora sp. NPDC051575 TaxID=3154943 RepID=UPI00341E6974